MFQERSIDTSHFGDIVHMFISVEPQLAGSCKEKIFLLSHAVKCQITSMTTVEETETYCKHLYYAALTQWRCK